jgi:ABC-type uncharacterized transport system involved in gliding motility auxiliary subunit
MLNQDLRRFAPYGLMISALAAVAIFVFLVLYRSFNLQVQISLAVFVLGIALFVMLDPSRAHQLLTGRQARHGSNALVMALAFLGILIVINYLAYQNTRRWDLTEDQQNTLAPETLETLKSLQEPVKAEAYYTINSPVGQAQTLLANYKANGQGKFDYEIIDPDAEPLRARQANITRDGTIVLVSGQLREQVRFVSEQEVTAAIIRLANPGSRAVYFLVGHGEYDINDASTERTYASVKTALTTKNYIVNSLNLLSNPEIPPDALAIIIAGPTKPLSGPEVQLMQSYLDNGGALIYLNEPAPLTQFGDTPDPLAAYLELAWGIRFGNDIVIDLNNQNQPLVAIASQFGSHPITQKMATMAVLLPTARSVQAIEALPQGVTQTVLALTAERAWGETDLEALQNNEDVAMDESVDLVGPVSIAMAAENGATTGRVVVVGDADFAGGENSMMYGNGDFLLNAIDWAAEQENLISLSPKQPTTRMLVMPDGVSQGLVLLGSICLLPTVVLVAGISVWLQRRRRG